MEGQWSKTSESETDGSTVDSNTPRWSHNQRGNEENDEQLAEVVRRHLSIEGHDPRVRYGHEISSTDYFDGVDEENGSALESISRWWKHVIGSLLIAPALFIVLIGAAILHVEVGSQVTLILMTAIAILFLVARFALPIAIYRDTDAIGESHVEWNPKRWVYVLGTTIVPPPMEFFTATIYITRRYRFVGVPNVRMALGWVRSKTESAVQQLRETNKA